MALADILQNIIHGAPPSENTQAIVDQLGPDNPIATYMMGRHYGNPTPRLIEAATSYGLQNRGMKLNERQLNAQLANVTPEMAGQITADNPMRWLMTPGQERYVNDLQQASTYQGQINNQAKYNAGVDSLLTTLRNTPGVDPNNPIFAMLDQSGRNAFTPEQIGQAVTNTFAGSNDAGKKKTLADSFLQGFKGDPTVDKDDYFILSHPEQFDAQTIAKAGYGLQNYTANQETQKAAIQQTSDFYDGFVQKVIPPAMQQSFMTPAIKSYYMNNPEAMQKLVTQWTPQPEKPMSELDKARLGLIQAQTADELRDAGEPYRGEGGGRGGRRGGGKQDDSYGPGYNDPSDVKIANNLRQEYKLSHNLKDGDEIKEADFRNWILQKKGSQAWRQYMYESTGDASVLGVKAPAGVNKEAWNAADKLVIQNGGIVRAIHTVGANTPDQVVDSLILRYNIVNGTRWTKQDWINAFRHHWEVPRR